MLVAHEHRLDADSPSRNRLSPIGRSKCGHEEEGNRLSLIPVCVISDGACAALHMGFMQAESLRLGSSMSPRRVIVVTPNVSLGMPDDL